jgi:hypothetical protein
MVISMFQPLEPSLQRLCRVFIDVAAPLSLGMAAFGERRIVNILGGRFEAAGETPLTAALTGQVLPGGADWQIVRDACTTEVEARFTLQCTDGSLIYVRNTGIRTGPAAVIAQLLSGNAVDPALYSFRMTPRFETTAAHLLWLNAAVFVASGLRTQGQVVYDVYQVL